MQGKATLMGHPIHPMLIPFPIGFFVGALLCDIISVFSASPLWPSMAVALIGFGVIGALVAALFGFIDYATAPMSAAAKAAAAWHMWLNVLTIVIFVGAFFVRYNHPPSTFGYVLTVLGNGALSASGALGGHLAYHHRVGVDEGASARQATRRR